jgi:hypothetical protein
MKKILLPVLFTGAMVMFTGCAASVGYRVYDPYRSDYQVWSPSEGVYYRQWVDLNHRPYRDFRRLPREDQRAYWTWRHEHPR